MLAAALVDERLLGDLHRVGGGLDEVDCQLLLQKVGHGLLDKLVGDGLFRLVLVAGLGGEVAGDEDQAVLNVGPGDLGFIFIIFVIGAQIAVDGAEQSGAHGLLRGAAVFQPGGVVVVLDDVHRVGEAQRYADLYPVIVLVRPIPAGALGGEKHGGGEGGVACQLGHIVLDAVLVAEFGLLKGGAGLIAQHEGDAGVDHGLPLEHVGIVFQRNGDVGEYLQIGLPAEFGAGLVAGGVLGVETADVFALFKVKRIFFAVPVDGGVKVFGGILGGAGTKAVQAEGELIGVAVAAAVFAAGVQFTEHQLPVVALLCVVPVHRAAPAEVLHLDGAVGVAGDDDLVAVAAAGLVDGVGEDLEHRVLAALQSVGAENNAGALTHPVGALQRGDGLVVVCFFLWSLSWHI